MTVHESRRVRRRSLAALGCLALALAGCTESSSGGGNNGPASSTVSVDESLLGPIHKATGTPLKIGFVDDGTNATTPGEGPWETAQAAAAYANEHLNGINGHPIVLDHCRTNFTTAGASHCGIQMVKDKVAAMIGLALDNDGPVYDAMEGAGGKIPYISTTTGSTDILAGLNAYVLSNGFASLATLIATAQSQHIAKAGIIIIDRPAAAQVGQIAAPLFEKGKIKEDFIQVGDNVDPTGILDSHIRSGTGAFSITGTVPFTVAVVKALRNLKFKGPVLLTTPPSPDLLSGLSGVPGGISGYQYASSMTTDENDPGRKLYNAVMKKYRGGNPGGLLPETGYINVLAVQARLQGFPQAVDPASIDKVFKTARSYVPLPLGGGIKFRCGDNLIAFTPNFCGTQVLRATLNSKGVPVGYKLVDTKAYF